MKTIILAAGVASRLRPLTNKTPKCLLNIGNKCLLERTIDNLLKNGLNDIVIVTGYLQNMIREFVSSHYPTLDVTYIHNEIYDSTNNIYSLWLTKSEVFNNSILLLDSDILFDSRIIKNLLDSEYPNCLALNKHELGEEEIKVIVDSSSKIVEISKTCSFQEAIGESIGIEKFSEDLVYQLFDELDEMILEKKQDNIFYEAAFENIIKKNAEIYTIDTTQYFSMELDTIEDFEAACNKIPLNLQ